MTARDSITRARARTPGAEDYPTSTAAHDRALGPTQRGITDVVPACAKGGHKLQMSRCMPGAGLSWSSAGRCRPTCQPSSRIGENPPYGMIGGIEETSASFEARSAPRSYPTEGFGVKFPGSTRQRPPGRHADSPQVHFKHRTPKPPTEGAGQRQLLPSGALSDARVIDVSFDPELPAGVPMS